MTGDGICTASTGSTVCLVLGYAGNYDLEVGAPGYQSQQQNVVVSGTNPMCGCQTTNTARLDIALVP
jgi:hypothetical protein